MKFVGSGRGDWLAQKTYRFVGNGEGTHNREEPPALPESHRFRCYGLVAAGSFCAALALLCAVCSLTTQAAKASAGMPTTFATSSGTTLRPSAPVESDLTRAAVSSGSWTTAAPSGSV